MDIVISGARPYDGRYPMIPFNRYEQGQIRRLAGWMPLQYEEALQGGDAEFVAMIAVLAMKRAGSVAREDVADVFQRLLEMDGCEITLEGEEAADEPGPPPTSSGENRSSSTPDISPSSETSQRSPTPIGTPGSDISESAPTRLVS